MKRAAVFIDSENVRIELGKKGMCFHKDDVLIKIQNYLFQAGYTCNHIYSYDDFDSSHNKKEDYLKRLSALNIIPKQVLANSQYKNSADIELCLDAFESSYDPNIDSIIIISSDKDMFPLVKKLKYHHKEVVLIGLTFNASNYVIRNASKFIPLEEIVNFPYDPEYVIKKDIIVCVKRIKNLYDWAKNKKGQDLGKDYCIERLKSEMFCDKDHALKVYDILLTNNIVEEYTYTYKHSQLLGVKFTDSEEGNNILDDKIPNFC